MILEVFLFVILDVDVELFVVIDIVLLAACAQPVVARDCEELRPQTVDGLLGSM